MKPTFADLGIPSEILAALRQRGYTTPFDIQISTIPDALAGRDICGRAATGSGKTLAFGVALAARVGKARPRHPRGLVLAPTRELAEQIRLELTPLAAACGRSIASVYGGVAYEPQRRALRRGVDIVVACPGRLADLIQQGDVVLSEVDHVVIDEADRMADMGFLPEVRRLLDQTSKKRQTLLFSATLDDEVAVITRDYQRDPVVHEVGAGGPDTIGAQHHFWRVDREHRQSVTGDVIRAAGRTIVFSRTCHGADRIARKLNHAGVGAAAIHGRRTQKQRDRALADFSRGTVQALVATDVAARGIHVEGVSCVLHFDMPGDAKAYVHRSGRTARAGATGVVVSLVSDEQIADLRAMQSALGLHGAVAPPAPERLFGLDGSPATAPRPDRPVLSVPQGSVPAGRTPTPPERPAGDRNGRGPRRRGRRAARARV